MQNPQPVPALVLLSAALVMLGMTIGIVGFVAPLIKNPGETLSIFAAICIFVFGGAGLSYKFLRQQEPQL